ncbi:HET-domain-containing protein, partial [Westerdykella ornata]
WLNRCISSHDRCNQDLNVAWYPTRLLDLRGSDTSLRLITTDEIKPCGDYATLIHVWGNIPIPKLQSQNLERWTNKIEMSELPKTFQEAISITKGFGINYLWIDALCIIQDSSEDAIREATLRSKVYKHSLLALSAAGAKDASDGCVFERNIRIYDEPPQCPMFQDHDWTKELSLEIEEKYYIVDAEFWRTLCMRTPLFRRAWTFQERFLARRVLHFGRD